MISVGASVLLASSLSEDNSNFYEKHVLYSGIKGGQYDNILNTILQLNVKLCLLETVRVVKIQALEKNTFEEKGCVLNLMLGHFSEKF